MRINTKTGHKGRIPVIIALKDCVSGVVSWARRLRNTFKKHKKYRVMLLACMTDYSKSSDYDFYADSYETARGVIGKLAPCIVAPNFVLSLYDICAELISNGMDVRCIGFCRSDSEKEYYNPLSWYKEIVSRFIAVSPECAQKLVQRIPEREADIRTLPTGVFVPPVLERDYMTSPVRLIYGGRISHEQKRVMDFIPLVKHLLEMDVDFKFDIAGEGSHAKKLREGINEIPHGGRVCFTGRIEPVRMNEIWSEHDVFIQASDYEGTSNSMLESMAWGVVPVVTESSSGIHGIIEHGRNSMIVPVGDMKRMASSIAEIAINREMLKSMGMSAYKTSKQYSMELYQSKFESILDGIMGDKPQYESKITISGKPSDMNGVFLTRRNNSMENSLAVSNPAVII